MGALKSLGFKRSWNKYGAIEGLPLQLLIVVIVAGVALAIMLGWVFSIQSVNVIKSISADPDRIEITGSSIDQEAKKTLTIKVRVYDQNNNPLSNVVVSLNGAGVLSTHADDDDGTVDGMVTFSSVQAKVPIGQTTATIKVTAEKAGFPTKETSILVVRII